MPDPRLSHRACRSILERRVFSLPSPPLPHPLPPSLPQGTGSSCLCPQPQLDLVQELRRLSTQDKPAMSALPRSAPQQPSGAELHLSLTSQLLDQASLVLGGFPDHITPGLLLFLLLHLPQLPVPETFMSMLVPVRVAHTSERRNVLPGTLG